jgi:hypothetical protein
MGVASLLLYIGLLLLLVGITAAYYEFLLPYSAPRGVSRLWQVLGLALPTDGGFWSLQNSCKSQGLLYDAFLNISGYLLGLLHGCCTLPALGELAHLGTPPFAGISWWAMLGSNQRPLPCESGPCSFATVRRYPISAFLSLITRCLRRGRSLSSAPVVVKLSSDCRLPKLLLPSYLYSLECME